MIVPMRATICVALFWFVTASPAGWSDSSQSTKLPQRDLEEILANDNRSPAGQLRDGVLTIVLEARTGIWYPEEKDGPGLDVQAFAEPGKALQIPGPLIRVPEGTEIHATVRNTIPNATLGIHGLHTRPGDPKDTINLAPGSTREVRFKAGSPGTYYYWGSTTGAPDIRERLSAQSQLSGAFIVDPRPAELGQRSAAGQLPSDDRVFVIGVWFLMDDPEAKPPRRREVLAINGRSWPHTEPLAYTV